MTHNDDSGPATAQLAWLDVFIEGAVQVSVATTPTSHEDTDRVPPPPMTGSAHPISVLAES